MSDLISRQAAIDAIRNIKAIKGTSDDKILLIDKAEAQTELMMLPSAQPEQKTGKWESIEDVIWYCSECKYAHSRSNYCPHCGAKML